MSEFKQVPLSEGIGRVLVCDDGKRHLIKSLEHSFAQNWCAVANQEAESPREQVTINYLSFSSQIMGKGVPPKDQQEAFVRAMQALTYTETPQTKQPRRDRNGIILL